MIRLRMAPSPTGNFHIGTLRTALFNWLVAQHEKGSFILRIEDTDLARSKPEYETNIIDYMAWMGLDTTEGPVEGGPHAPYRQSERITKGTYDVYAKKLQETGHAYLCFCSEDELDQERKTAQDLHLPYIYSRKCTHLTPAQVQENQAKGLKATLRFKMPQTGACEFEDLIRGPIKFENNLISDFVLVRSDGLPSYNFAVVADDYDMEITHVIRGEDHISNTPKQIAIFNALGLTPPLYGHLPMILAPDRSKLSKRHGATSVADYKAMGYLPDALFNYLVLLGWSSPTGEEILPKADIISQFTLNRVSKSGAIFDVAKLKWMNGQYIRKQSPESLLQLAKPYFSEEIIQKSASIDPKKLEKMVFSIKDNLDLLTDVNAHLAVYFLSPTQFNDAIAPIAFTESDQLVISKWKAWLDTHTELTPETVQAGLDHVLAQTQLPKGKVFKPIRQACSGLGNGPHLPDLLSILPLQTLSERCSLCLNK